MNDWPTIPDLSKVIGLSEKMLHNYADEGILEVIEDPKSVAKGLKARRKINPFLLPEFLIKELKIPPKYAREKMLELGFSFFKEAVA